MKWTAKTFVALCVADPEYLAASFAVQEADP